MKLSAKLIVYHLKKAFPVRASSSLSPCPVLSCSLPYRKDKPFQSGRVYVVTDPDFTVPSHHLTSVLFILTGSTFPLCEQDYPNLCILPKDTKAADVYAELQEIFSLYEQWNQSLVDSRLENASIQSLLDLTDCVIPNPMLLIGMDFTIVASKKLDLMDLNKPVLGSSESTRDIINSLKQDPNYEEAFYKTGYFFYPGNRFSAPALCVNISGGGHTVYRLLYMEGEAPLDDTFGFILEYLAQMVTHAFSTRLMRGPSSDYPLHEVFATLLTDPHSDYVKISQQISARGWLSSHIYLCILVRTGLIDQKNLTLLSICNYIETTLPFSCAVEHRGNAVVFVNLSLIEMTVEEIAGKLEGFIQNSMLNAGFSRKMLGHFNFHRQYLQASVALETGKRKNPALSIHHFNAVALDYILEQAIKKLPAYMICHEKLLSLKYADEAGHSHLYETLRRFLENHQNIARTSEALDIHRSTLLYRMDKIRAFLKSDLSDPPEILYLLLSFHLMELEENQSSR